MQSFLKRKYARVSYYVRNAVADALPYSLYQTRLKQIYAELSCTGLAPAIIGRVNHYNKLPMASKLSDAIAAKDIPLEATYYYYDLKEFLNYFPRDLLLRYKFGDLRGLLETPSICKTRPICENNSNSVIFKLDKLRHFSIATDLLRFKEKKKACVWRGNLNNKTRTTLVRAFSGSTKHDIGYIGHPIKDVAPKDFLSTGSQFAYRYILSVEGNDVATNLKNVLASQSLCFMPKPKIESWFMESQLKPGVHFVQLRDDFADLEEKADYYDRHEDEALAIIREANSYTAQFLDRRSEAIVSILVLQKYFESLGQLPSSQFSRMFWSVV
jgi:hypothetical protein